MYEVVEGDPVETMFQLSTNGEMNNTGPFIDGIITAEAHGTAG